MASGDSSKVWFITGTSSGFGRRLVFSALARGDRVIATARSPGKLSELFDDCPNTLRTSLRTLKLDVTEGRTSIERPHILVNNAGVLIAPIERRGNECEFWD